MKKQLGKLFILAALMIGIVGCASANKKVFMAEYATAATADASMRGYAAYFDQAIQHPDQYNRTADGLIAERAKLSDLSIKTGVSIDMVEHLRQSAATNSATTPSLTAAIQIMSDNRSNILWTAQQFLNTTNK